MKADAAIDRAREAVAPRTIDRELAEQREHDERKRSRDLPEQTAAERGEKKHHVDRHQQHDGNQEAEQKLARGADVFKAVARDLGIAPEETANVGREPEAIDAERHRQKDRAADQQPPERLFARREPPAAWR